jgi:C-terminal processing protease CtpA/Prc
MNPIARSITHKLLPFAMLLVLLAFAGCGKEEDENIGGIENREFYNLMLEWYFWNETIPDINPLAYPSPYEVMEAIRHRPDDRWSYVTSREAFEAYYAENRMIGYGFGIGWDADGRLRVLYVSEGTDLHEAGVRRSWIIEAINGTTLAPGMNISQMLGANQTGVTNSFRFRKPDGETVTLSLDKKEITMQLVLHADVLETGDKKVGYLVLQGFTSPTVAELNNALDLFVQEGIDELVLDMRYNGGGQTSVANYLSSMIGGGKVAGKVFSQSMYNAQQQQANQTDTFLVVSRQLELDRLLTIATGNTASASEMVINGLRPYMPVLIFGDDTYGKPMGANAWTYGDEYAFVPITFKIANSLGEGEYFGGLPADGRAQDDLTRQFGDPEEASLKAALHYIRTGEFVQQPVKTTAWEQPRDRLTGLRHIIGAF